MRKCTLGEIIKVVPNVQTVRLPDNWINNLNDETSVFVSLYEWMLENGRIPLDDKDTLIGRTYVGENIYAKLVKAEKNRLRKKLKIDGDELDDAVTWSDIDSGPKTGIGSCKIGGDVIFVIPETSRQALSQFGITISAKNREADIKKIRNNAAGSTFYLWILSQTDRSDRVGDFARDLDANIDFPRNCIHFEEIKIYLDTVGACDAAIESFKEAWLEYAHKYPERIEPLAWCNECGQQLPINHARLSWSTETQEIYILDEKCLDKYQRFDELISRPLSTVTHSDLEDLVEKEDLSEYDVERLTETLTLWGALPINCPGSVYFIQSEKTHAVKIGFTSGLIEKRLAALQTAHPYKLQLLAALAGTVAYEKSLHDRFAKFRLEGEWFEPHPDLVAFISVVRLGLGHNNSQERTE